MYTKENFAQLEHDVRTGKRADPTPYGLFGDHCPFCSRDWKQDHHEDCESPWNVTLLFDAERERWEEVSPGTVAYFPGRYLNYDPRRMTAEAIAAAPRHPQLMSPAADPEELIAASLWWWPTLFASRTDVLDHLLLGTGNGYEWGSDGNLHSVFAHTEPDYRRLEHYFEKQEAEALKYEGNENSPELRDLLARQARERREELDAQLATRAQYLTRARAYGPVRTTVNFPEGPVPRSFRTTMGRKYTLLFTAPGNVTPAWQAVLDEARVLFAELIEPEEEEST